jgi:Flp pilus assembly pilin Flp
LFEFTLLVALVMITTITAVNNFSGAIRGKFDDASAELATGAGGVCEPGNPNFPACLNP